MAFRPVFAAASKEEGFVKTENVEFQWYPGFAASQKQKSIQSLHTQYLKLRPGARILEVSTKSPDPLGRVLSAFHLKLSVENERIPVENVFQASKVFAPRWPLHRSSRSATPRGQTGIPACVNLGLCNRSSGRTRCFPWNRRLFFTTGSTSQRLLRTQISLNVLWSTTALRILSSTPRSPSTVKRSRVPCLSLSIARVT